MSSPAKRIFVATPAYGGLISAAYAESQLASALWCLRNGIQFAWIYVTNDALIVRARNRCVGTFLRTDFTHLLFADADLGWNPQDLANLLAADVPVVAGTYPIKQLPIKLNFNVLKEDLLDCAVASLDPYCETGFQRWREQRADARGLVEVRHVPTGFLLIERSVFEQLVPHVDSYACDYPEAPPNAIDYNFFPATISQGTLLSEDWAFCELCRSHGIPIYLNTNVIASHMGNYQFKMKV